VWGEDGEDLVVQAGEIFHAVLEVAHVAEEVFGEFFDGFYGWSGSERGTGGGVGHLVVVWRGGYCWGGGMAGDEGGN